MEQVTKFVLSRLRLAEQRPVSASVFEAQAYGALVYHCEMHPQDEEMLIPMWEEWQQKFWEFQKNAWQTPQSML